MIRIVLDIAGFILLAAYGLVILSGMVFMAAQAIDFLARAM